MPAERPGRAFDKIGDMFKLIILPRTKSGLGREGLRRHLEQVHGPMVMAHAEVSDVFLSYVHHYALGEVARPFGDHLLADRDAVTVIRFATVQDAARSKDTAGYRDVVGPDEDNFRELAGSVGLRSQEEIILPDAPEANRKLFLFSSGDRSERAARLATLAGAKGVSGLISNAVEPIEGEWPYSVIEEIALLPDADLVALGERMEAADLLAQASVLMTDLKTFRRLG